MKKFDGIVIDMEYGAAVTIKNLNVVGNMVAVSTGNAGVLF